LPEPPPPPPVPILAVLNLGAGRWSLKFDQPLQVRTVSASNLNLRHNRFKRALFNIQITGPFVTGTFFTGSPTGPGSLIDYFATPEQIFNAGGVPAAPFADYPVQVV
jgi:hypothetical protein